MSSAIISLNNISLVQIIDWLVSSSLYLPGKPLFFTDGFFILFLFLFLAAYTFIGNQPRRRIAVILFFSLWFYYKSSGIFIAVILFSAVVTYFAGFYVHETKNRQLRRLILFSGILANIALLGYFKYSPFYHQLSGVFNAFNLGIGAIAFPVGLSFYTFCNLSYLLDVNKRAIAAEPSFVVYLSYITFFPTVQMGPIERAGHLLPQIKSRFNVTREDFNEGFLLIINGMIKKMVIGDFINHQLVMNIFSSPGRYTGMENLAAVLGYSLVIYCDFSGYTDMARGFARWMGLRIGLNFNFPYQSWNIGEFWRRWHISLSSWLRDYIFMPIAFRLSSVMKQDYLFSAKYIRTELVIFAIGSLITFTICGIWHGTGINFLIWGLMHGVALSIQKIWSFSTRKYRKNRTPASRGLHRKLGIMLTFIFVASSWVFFRMPTPDDTLQVFSQIAGNFAISAFPAFLAAYYPSLIMMLLGYLLHFAPENLRNRVQKEILDISWPGKLAVASVAIGLVVYFQGMGSGMPIYIQF